MKPCDCDVSVKDKITDELMEKIDDNPTFIQDMSCLFKKECHNDTLYRHQDVESTSSDEVIINQQRHEDIIEESSYIKDNDSDDAETVDKNQD